jgi:hypothetical protein
MKVPVEFSSLNAFAAISLLPVSTKSSQESCIPEHLDSITPGQEGREKE